MANIKVGDRVKIANREATPQDLKSGLFYNHLRGLVGSVRKVYSGDEVAVEIDTDALAEDVWKRHMQTRDQMRERWIAGLPDDVKRKLTPEQRQFDLRYVVLVRLTDLEKQRARRSK